MKNLMIRDARLGNELDLNLPPLSDVADMFRDITKNALTLGLMEVIKLFSDRHLRIATMCPGTESPILALDMIRKVLKSDYSLDFAIEHVFSAEIDPVKQAYIERNFTVPHILRDITELKDVREGDVPMATIVYVSKVQVPTDLHMLIAGTSCVVRILTTTKRASETVESRVKRTKLYLHTAELLKPRSLYWRTYNVLHGIK